jgi:hypothetical protein
VAAMTADMRHLNQITRRQRSLITRAQAFEAGLTEGEIQSLLRRRIWFEIRPRVYAVAGAPQSWAQVVQATLLSAAPDTWASHQTGAHLYGVRRIERPEVLEVLTGLDRRVTLAGVVGRRSRELFDADLTTRLGIPCVSAPRALVDIAGLLSHDQLGRALDDLLRRKLCTLDEVRRCVDRLHPGPGRPLKGMQRVLAERWPGYDPGDSDLETRALRAIAKAGLPLPKQQHRMRLRGKSVRIDLAYPDLKIAIEVDSWEYHGQVRSQFDCDHIRRDELVLLQWTPFTFTSAMSDEYLASSTRTLLERAGAVIDDSTAA